MLGKTALGKYRLLRSLGSGNNGEVFLAEPVRYPNHRVVVKRVHDEVVAHPKFQQLFEAEVRSMRNFTHPYSVRLLDASVNDPIGPCLVMEYVPGVTLESVLTRRQKLDPMRVGRLLAYLCHALQAAHDAGIIHRDLKPANLMVVNAGQPTETIKVMDFGFAGFVARPHIQLAELTGEGSIVAIGTPQYVSPEMIRGDRVDTRSDLYAVGVMLFEMLTGRLPFRQEVMDELLAAHVMEPPPRFSRVGCADIPPGVEEVVQLALSKYPIERQQTAREIAEGYGKALGEQFWEGTAPEGYEPPPRAQTYIPAHTPASHPGVKIPNPYRIDDTFQVTIPERMVAAKLRGFVEDVDATVLASEPGLIRLQVGQPSGYQSKPVGTGSTLLGWITGRTPPPPAPTKGQEPIAVELHMEKPDPGLTLLRVSVACSPVKENPPTDLPLWQTRCGKLQAMIRQYLGARYEQ